MTNYRDNIITSIYGGDAPIAHDYSSTSTSNYTIYTNAPPSRFLNIFASWTKQQPAQSRELFSILRQPLLCGQMARRLL